MTFATLSAGASERDEDELTQLRDRMVALMVRNGWRRSMRMEG